MTFGLGYSFVNLGFSCTDITYNNDPKFNLLNDDMPFKNITSYDFKLGARYSMT